MFRMMRAATSAKKRAREKQRIKSKISPAIPLLPILILVNSFVLRQSKAGAADALVVYTYDSFLGKGSLGDLAKEQFEKQSGFKIRFVSFGSAGEALNQVLLEKDKTVADVVVGIDSGLKARALQSGLFQAWRNLPKEALDDPIQRWDPSSSLVPFDYGYLAFVYDSRRVSVSRPSMRMIDFASQKAWRKKVVIEDPRTSSLGLGFLIATHQALGEGVAENFWRSFSQQLVTISPGWSAAYGLFLKKEADFVLSYTTSPAYHREKEGIDAFRSLLFEEGNYLQVEGVGLVKFSRHVKPAQAFLSWLLSEKTQDQLPKLQWMYPARKGTPLPASFQGLSHVKKTLEPSRNWNESTKKKWVRNWQQWLAESR